MTARMGGKSKRKRPRERWTDEVEEDLKINENKKLAYSGQRPGRMEEEFVGSQGPQRTLVYDDDNDDDADDD